jgi:arginine-tRNA-protein transferase
MTADRVLQIVDVLRFTAPPDRCSYLPKETASLEYRYAPGLGGAQFQELLRRGWRRHGLTIFRPACPSCTKCRSLRVDVRRFEPTKSQRRTLRRNAEVQVTLAESAVTDEHLRLYNDYHSDMHQRRGWPHDRITAGQYHESFLAGGWPFAREVRYYRNGRLAGVGLVDLVPDGLSSVYFYHDPDWRPLGPGTYSILQELQLARDLGLRYVYLGYWIAECPSMAYKGRFAPHEILARYPADDEEPLWQ